MVWGMGNFGGVSLEQLPAFSLLTVVGLLVAVMLIKPLNALLLGPRYAENLGVNIRRVRNFLLLATGLLTAVTTSFCGPISFIGLAVPHLARLMLGKKAKNIAMDFVGRDQIKEISSNGLAENADIPTYDFNVKLNNQDDSNELTISITKKGGHILFSNFNRDVEVENIDDETANKIGLDFLNSKGYTNMKRTYYLKEEGVMTINYAYVQNDVTMYPDLIKLKVALDNGDILGIETQGYLNSHTERNIPEVKVSKEDAKKTLNKNLEIKSEGLAIIPTEYKTEILCWEFKGTVDDTDFLVYINAETGKEEDILTIVNTPNGTLTM